MTLRSMFMVAVACTASWTAPAAARVSDSMLASCERLITEGRTDDARERLMDARRDDPTDPRPLLMLARLETDVKTALALMREAERMALTPPGGAPPDSSTAAGALVARAAMMLATGDAAGASELYRDALSRFPANPRHADAVYGLGRARLAAGAFEEAEVHFESYLGAFPGGQYRVLAAAGVMECRVGLRDWEGAIEMARRVLDEPDDEAGLTPRVLEVMAQGWRVLGNDQNADWYTNRLLTGYPDSFQAHEAREKARRAAMAGGMIYADDTPIDTADQTAATGPDGDTDTGYSEVEADDIPAASASAPTPASDQRGTFTLQAGAFKDRTNALAHYENLKRKGLDARVDMKTVGGSHFYVVLVGAYADRGEAEVALRSAVRVSGENMNIVVQE